MKTSPVSSVSFWLCPSARNSASIEKVIQQTSERLDTPSFLPHVTVGSADMEPARARTVLADLARGGNICGTMTTPFHGDGSNISLTMGYTFELAEASKGQFHALSQSLRELGLSTVTQEADLHMSLTYKKGGISVQAARQIQQAAEDATLISKPMELSTLVAVGLERPFVDEQQVKEWDFLGEVSLTESATENA